MLRGLLKKWLPNRDSIKKEKSLQWLHGFLHDPNLWHLNRRSVAGGVAAGLLVAFIPLPIQMLLAVLLAIAFRFNVLIAAIATWVSNPITFFPINYAIYKVGSLVINEKNVNVSHIKEFNFNMSNLGSLCREFFNWFVSLGKPYLVGLPIVSIASALLGYIAVRLLWRSLITLHLYRRKRKLSRKT